MPATSPHPVCLVVLDGWGYRADTTANAIALAETPNWDRLLRTLPHTLIEASGRRVGLPAGQMGNSEVGHMNLGAGRVVEQDLVRIAAAIETGTFFTNRALVAACRDAASRGVTLHLIGLLGTGGVHALDRHLFALLDLASRENVPRVALHGMLDGRDTPPNSGRGFLAETQAEIAKYPGRAVLATLGGRYFGMDRDHRWDRSEKWYRAMVDGVGDSATADSVATVLESAYAAGTTDEFVEPIVLRDADGQPAPRLANGDVVICFNFRSDRMRQLCDALSSPAFNGFGIEGRPQLSITTMMEYDPTFTYPVAFPASQLTNMVGEVIANAGMTQLRTAETEKYPHVTFFFNGGRETPFAGEERRMVPSPKVATYDQKPEMSAEGICDGLVEALATRRYDFMLCNFANCDMVGHTGSLPAAIAAVEAVDACIGRILVAAEAGGARVILTADHGNADVMVDPVTGAPHTAHTTNPVPLLIVDPVGAAPLRAGGALCDVGPTVLELLGLAVPAEMSGRSLRLAAVPA
ncbi:MAG TPA: 2,3-bisphosphoglycerate-independent phosphoglycerate mutase [Gemmatimonadaceae bacterium]|nr:2,3-bisphosphoglycerate-independent phosphoglycerate mutase [Gemmatimonadaceae bacterium]